MNQAITWINADLSSVMSYGIYLRAISQDMLKVSISRIYCKITHLIFLLYLQGNEELNAIEQQANTWINYRDDPWYCKVSPGHDQDWLKVSHDFPVPNWLLSITACDIMSDLLLIGLLRSRGNKIVIHIELKYLHSGN